MTEGTTVEAEVIRLPQNIATQMRRRILEAIVVGTAKLEPASELASNRGWRRRDEASAFQ